MGEIQDMIEGLEIFDKYTDDKYVFYSQHDVIGIGVSPTEVSDKDKEKLDDLGFYPKPEYDSFEFLT